MATDKGFTTVGGDEHCAIAPAINRSLTALSTNTRFSKADLLFRKHICGGVVRRGMIYPLEMVSTTNWEAPMSFQNCT
jgi:hypothetical protein